MILKRCLFLTITVAVVAKPFGADSREKRSDDRGPLEVVVERLAQQVNSLSTQLTQQVNYLNAQSTQQINSLNVKLTQQTSDFNAQLNLLNTTLAVLKNRTDTLDKTVAFYAWNSNQPLRTGAHGTLVFDHAVTNVGNAYNTLTGVFTVPVSGLYHFQTTFVSYYVGTGQYVHAAIYVDNTLNAEGISDTQHGHSDQTTISATIHVKAGQQVYIKNTDNEAKDFFSHLTEPRTTFSGFLLHAD